METQSLYSAEMKIIIDCVHSMERKDLRKFVNREKGVWKEKAERKERHGCENIS